MNLPVESVIDAYRSRRTDWSSIDRQAIGDGVRAPWSNERQGLEVTAIPAPTVGTATGSSTEGDVQYTRLFGPLEDVLAGTSGSTTAATRATTSAESIANTSTASRGAAAPRGATRAHTRHGALAFARSTLTRSTRHPRPGSGRAVDSGVVRPRPDDGTRASTREHGPPLGCDLVRCLARFAAGSAWTRCEPVVATSSDWLGGLVRRGSSRVAPARVPGAMRSGSTRRSRPMATDDPSATLDRRGGGSPRPMYEPSLPACRRIGVGRSARGARVARWVGAPDAERAPPRRRRKS